MDRRHGARTLVLILVSLILLVLIICQYNTSQKFVSSGKLSELLEVIDNCASSGAGALNNSTEGPGGGIPNIVHQVWKTPDVRTYITELGASHEAWKTAFEPLNYTVKLWTDNDVLDLIKTGYPWLLSTYENYPRNIQRADLARLAIVHAEGGIYADLDVYPQNATQTQCLQHLGFQAIFAPTQSGDLGLSNHFFLAEQGSPFLLWTLHKAKRRAVSASLRVLLPYLNVLWTTGPLMVTAAVREYAWLYSGAQRLDVGVLDEDRFRREIVWHAAGRSWHGWDGWALNYVADHTTKTVFMAVLVVLSVWGLVRLVSRRCSCGDGGPGFGHTKTVLAGSVAVRGFKRV